MTPTLRSMSRRMGARARIHGVALAALLIGLTACGDASDPSGPPAKAHVRVINSIFQGDSATAVARAIDFLIDSSAVAPGVTALAANSVSVGDGGAAFNTLGSDVHAFAARIASATPNPTLYTTIGDVPYTPKQFLASGFYYTVVAAGIAPATGSPSANGIPYVLLFDDIFPGPKFDGAYQARFRLVNAAPYAAANGGGAPVDLYITPGTTPPARPITDYSPLGNAPYRNASGYVNLNAGTYLLTAVAAGNVIIQQPITLASGEVRTLVLQSTAPAATPGTANHKLTSVLDRSWAN